MSEQVKRYEMIAGDGPGVYPETEPNGDWVRYNDYATLQAECERLAELSDALESIIGRQAIIIEQLRTKLTAIKAQSAKNVLLAQLEKPSDLVTGTTNWAAYIASSITKIHTKSGTHEND